MILILVALLHACSNGTPLDSPPLMFPIMKALCRTDQIPGRLVRPVLLDEVHEVVVDKLSPQLLPPPLVQTPGVQFNRHFEYWA